MISDLVSSGQTFRIIACARLQDGVIQASQAALIANRKALETNPAALEMARRLLEYIEAHMRAKENLLVIANMRGESPEAIAEQTLHADLRRRLAGTNHQPDCARARRIKTGIRLQLSCGAIIFHKPFGQLRQIGGSGIIVSPVTYIFEEEPPRYTAMLAELKIGTDDERALFLDLDLFCFHRRYHQRGITMKIRTPP